MWARQFGSTGSDAATRVAADSRGNTIVALNVPEPSAAAAVLLDGAGLLFAPRRVRSRS